MAYPLHFTLPAAHCSSHDICILFSARDGNCTLVSEMAADLRHLLSEKKQVVMKKKKKKKKKCDCTAIMCDCLKANMGCCPMCLLLLPSQSDPPPFPPCVCLQPTAAMLIIWRLRWASLTLWWRPSADCCCSQWARRATLHRGHGTLKRVGSTKLTSSSTHFMHFPSANDSVHTDLVYICINALWVHYI